MVGVDADEVRLGEVREDVHDGQVGRFQALENARIRHACDDATIAIQRTRDHQFGGGHESEPPVAPKLAESRDAANHVSAVFAGVLDDEGDSLHECCLLCN